MAFQTAIWPVNRLGSRVNPSVRCYARWNTSHNDARVSPIHFGPTVFDRILALNMFGTKTVLLIAVAGFWANRPDFMDLALVYALVNFTGTVAVLKFTKFGNLATDEPIEGAD